MVKERDGRDARILYMVQAVIDAIGPEDAEQFVRICEKFLHAEIQI